MSVIQSNQLSENDIFKSLDKKYRGLNILIFDNVKSTNDISKALIKNSYMDKCIVVIANQQTDGRGQRGKLFYSPAGCGVYMSIIIDIKNYFSDLQFLTQFSAVSVCSALEKITGKSIFIKWVNDLIYKNKKISGILTEVCNDIQNRRLAVIGIGINVSTGGFPVEIQDIAGSLYEAHEEAVPRNVIIAEILNNVFYNYYNINREQILSIYNKKLFLNGDQIGASKYSKT